MKRKQQAKPPKWVAIRAGARVVGWIEVFWGGRRYYTVPGASRQIDGPKLDISRAWIEP